VRLCEEIASPGMGSDDRIRSRGKGGANSTNGLAWIEIVGALKPVSPLPIYSFAVWTNTPTRPGPYR